MPNWFVVRNDAEQGPLSSEQLRKLVIAGQVRPDDLVRREDISKPVRAESVKGLFDERPTTGKPPESTKPPVPPKPPGVPPVQVASSSQTIPLTPISPIPSGPVAAKKSTGSPMKLVAFGCLGAFGLFLLCCFGGIGMIAVSKDLKKGATSATGSDVLTADFYPFKQGHRYQMSGVNDSLGVNFVREYSHQSGGIIQRKWLMMFTTGIPEIPVPKGIEQEHFRVKDGYIEIGEEVEFTKLMNWSPLVKIGATAGDTWSRQIREGHHESFKLVEFGTREVINKGFLPGDKVFCAVIEKTATISTPKEPMVFIEEIVLARGIGPFRHSSWRIKSGERERNWWERLTVR